jgi:hypothetical protein
VLGDQCNETGVAQRMEAASVTPSRLSFFIASSLQPRTSVILIQCRTQSTFRDGAARNSWLRQAHLRCAQMSASVHKRRTVLVIKTLLLILARGIGKALPAGFDGKTEDERPLPRHAAAAVL